MLTDTIWNQVLITRIKNEKTIFPDTFWKLLMHFSPSYLLLFPILFASQPCFLLLRWVFDYSTSSNTSLARCMLTGADIFEAISLLINILCYSRTWNVGISILNEDYYSERKIATYKFDNIIWKMKRQKLKV